MFKKTAISLIMLISAPLCFAENNYAQQAYENIRIASNNSKESNAELNKLDQYLEEGKYASAYKIVQAQPAASLIGRLRPWAEKDMTVAQWFYAETLYKEKRYEESAKWTFIAFFYTRYDASLCKNKLALNLEKTIVDSYREVVEKSRSDKETMNIALNQAIDYLKSYNASRLSLRDPEWICDMVENYKDKRITVSSDYWDYIYKERLSQFIKTTTGQSYKFN